MAFRARFNLNRSYVVARDFTYGGHDFKVGDPFPPADGSIEVSPRHLERQYSSRAINMLPPGESAAEPAATPDPITIEAQSGGFYLISAPWLDAPERIRGKAAANEAADKLREEGEPATHHGVTVQQNPDGVWEVTAEWDPENIAASADEASARELAARWRQEGEPAPAPAENQDGVDVTVTEEDGKFVVRAAWLDDAESFDDEEAANTRATELLAEDAKAAAEFQALAQAGEEGQQDDDQAGDDKGDENDAPPADKE